MTTPSNSTKWEQKINELRRRAGYEPNAWYEERLIKFIHSLLAQARSEEEMKWRKILNSGKKMYESGVKEGKMGTLTKRGIRDYLRRSYPRLFKFLGNSL